MDAGTSPVVIHVQLILATEGSSFQSPIQGSIPIQASSLFSDILSRIQAAYKEQAGEELLAGLIEKSKSSFPPYHLTLREKEIIELLRKGKSHKQIAAELNIASRTVNKHLENIYEKLGVNRKYEVFNKLAQQTQL